MLDVHRELSGQFVVDERSGPQSADLCKVVGPISALDPCHSPFPETRLEGMNDDGPACHIASKQRSLRAAQHLDAAQVVEVWIVVPDTGRGNIIDERGDRI